MFACEAIATRARPQCQLAIEREGRRNGFFVFSEVAFTGFGDGPTLSHQMMRNCGPLIGRALTTGRYGSLHTLAGRRIREYVA
jgi:hypothetical protein